MVSIKQFNSTTLARIENQTTQNELRPYLGMSELGHACSRYLWYSFRWAFRAEISSRLRRLLKRGHREELAIIQELEQVGVICYGFQNEMVMAFGHSKGHNDGVAIGVIEAPKTPHLLEFKTMNDKYFKACKKDGVKKSKPVYWAQMQIYMSESNLTRALFCAVNKNDDSYYFERVCIDKSFAEELRDKAEYIVTSEVPPKKLSSSPTWYECKFCNAQYICHYSQPYYKTCRTCKYCDILPEGEWECGLRHIKLATGQQKIGCDSYATI